MSTGGWGPIHSGAQVVRPPSSEVVRRTSAVDSPLCVALDGSDEAELERLAELTEDSAGVFKVGLTAFCALGPRAVRGPLSRRPVFLDLKLHDIPAQVSGAAAAAAAMGVSYLTAHASGGREMVAAAADAAPNVAVLGVTVLTSLDAELLGRLGVAGSPRDQVLRLAEIALEGGAAGLVCSPLEAAALRARFGPSSDGGPLLVTPGIRSREDVSSDQRRTLSAAEARAAGADLLVVGRPISGAPEPGAAARAFRAELA